MHTEQRDIFELKQDDLWWLWEKCYGQYPTHFTYKFWNNEQEVNKALAQCKTYVQKLKETKQGRQELEDTGWIL